MGKKQYSELNGSYKKSILQQAGLDGNRSIELRSPRLGDDIEQLPSRINKLVELFRNHEPKTSGMLYFVMYDIESNKVRRQVAKYLLGMGCLRVQKSIFLADLTSEKSMKIKEDLAAVQGCYDNNDSILVLPVPSDYLKSMKIIGKNINIDLITKSKSTLFF